VSKSPAKPTPCPNCSGAPLFIESAGRRIQVKCGHSVCQSAEEERIAARVVALAKASGHVDIVATIMLPENRQRILAEIMRHLPPDIAKNAKRSG
jgi:hypothetical protein